MATKPGDPNPQLFWARDHMESLFHLLSLLRILSRMAFVCPKSSHRRLYKALNLRFGKCASLLPTNRCIWALLNVSNSTQDAADSEFLLPNLYLLQICMFTSFLAIAGASSARFGEGVCGSNGRELVALKWQFLPLGGSCASSDSASLPFK